MLGRDGLIEAPDRLLAYESDALTTIRGSPLAVVFPRSTVELAETVAALHAAGLPYVPRGAGTGLSGGAVAQEAVLVSTVRMNRILELDPVGRCATAEAGTVVADLDRAAAAHGLGYLPDPASATACTLGGNVGENAGGPHCLKHGVTTDHVLSLRVVLPDGATLRLGRGEDGGLDLAGLWIGAEGTLGMAAEVTVRLAPRPEQVRTALALFDRLRDAGEAVGELLAAGLTPVALEMVDNATIRMVEESVFAAGLPTDVEAALIIEVEGGAEEVAEDIRRVEATARAAGAREVRVAAEEEARARLWHARKKAYGALGRRAPEVLLQDAVVPRTALADVLERIESVGRRHGIPMINYFHAGDGNLHPHLLFDRRDPEATARVEKASEEIMALCVEAGGTITGEHGVGLDKRKAMRLIFSEAELDAMRAVRRAVDPADRCNPGKVIPPEQASED